MIRWGILGAARINRRLIPALRLARRSELVAVASRDRARVEAHAREWNIAEAVHGYEALLANPRIDAVYIPLPNSEHVSWTLAAIAAGKHVLCEKPIALTVGDIDRIAHAAASAGVIVEEGYMYRHEPMTSRVAALVHDGAIGTLRAIVSGFTFSLTDTVNIRLRPELGGGSLWDVGCYPVSYAQFLLGHAPTMVAGMAHWTATGVDDEFTGMLRFDEGVTASIYSGFRAGPRTWLELLGSDGSLTVPNPFKPGPEEGLELECGGQRDVIAVQGSPELFVRQVEDFEASVLDGRPPVVSLAESRRTVSTLAALYAAAREHGEKLYTH